MAESGIQLPNDGPGKMLRTEQVSVAGVNKEQQVVTLADSAGNLLPVLAVSVADGANVTQGAVADAAYTDGSGITSGSVIALLKGIFGFVAGVLTVKRDMGVTTVTTKTPNSLSAQMVAFNKSRKSLRMVSPASNTARIYLDFGSNAALTTSATFLDPGDTYYETDSADRINGRVASGSQTLVIYEVA